MIEPFFYGARGALAFYHPSNDLAATRLLVICPPLFDEYRRTYRALSDLATACSANGLHVIRIDYSGTGEANGLLMDVSNKEWIEDINLAIEEGINLTGADEVILAGVRMGATLAAQIEHHAVKRYVFWDPIENGENYLAWLKQNDQHSKIHFRNLAKMVNQQPEEIDFTSFALKPSLLNYLATLETNTLTKQKSDSVWILSTNQEFCRQHRNLNCEYTGYSYDWPAYHDGMLTPKPVLERIAQTVLSI